MKKTYLFLLMIFCAVALHAQSYGILVNGKTYFAGEPAGEFEGFTQYLAHVQVSNGDKLQLYDATNKAAWAVALNSYSEQGFTYDAAAGCYTASVSGCYDFYIKLKWQADELYIGAGSNCGSGTPVGDAGTTDPTPNPGGGSSVPSQCTDVMLQGFYWDSYNDKGYGRTRWTDYVNKTVEDGITTQAEEVGQWFDLVWLPPFSKSTGGTGYLPICYSNLDSDWGQRSTLIKLISTLHQNGARVVADIVINHIAGSTGWCTFATQNFGTYGTFSPTSAWICSSDEMNTDPAAGSCNGKATGAYDDGYGSEANYGAGRDWDHNNAKVRDMCKAYLTWLRKVIKIDGFRYDYCKGFHNSHIDDYNKASEAYFSVMEYWDGDVNALQYHLNDANWNTLAFDFATKYTAFNDGIAADNYYKLKGAGLPGAGKSRYAVTFLDSHDSFQRDNNEFCGLGNSMKYPGKVQQCYAYMLSMPGIPCVFYPHWVSFKDKIKPMINARYKTGVHSESAVSDEAGNGYYKATITGTNGQIRLLVGPNSGYNSTPAGFTLAVKGENYGVYYKVNSPRGDKNTERNDITTGVEEIVEETPSVQTEKFMKDGKLYIRCGEQVFDITGQRIY